MGLSCISNTLKYTVQQVYGIYNKLNLHNFIMITSLFFKIYIYFV